MWRSSWRSSWRSEVQRSEGGCEHHCSKPLHFRVWRGADGRARTDNLRFTKTRRSVSPGLTPSRPPDISATIVRSRLIRSPHISGCCCQNCCQCTRCDRLGDRHLERVSRPSSPYFRVYARRPNPGILRLCVRHGPPASIGVVVSSVVTRGADESEICAGHERGVEGRGR
jgi:hypothetical protein